MSRRRRRQLLEVAERHVAHTEEPHAPGVALPRHRAPDLAVVGRPPVAGGGAVQHIAVDVVRSQVLERAGHRLRDLGRQVRRGIVGQPVVLSRLVRELRLEEEIFARDDPRAVGGGEPLPHAGLEVVAPLVRGVDAPEAAAERELGQLRGAVLLPGRAVEEVRGHSALAALAALRPRGAPPTRPGHPYARSRGRPGRTPSRPRRRRGGTRAPRRGPAAPRWPAALP